MNLFLPRHQEILSLLIKHNVDFLIIGGYAVIFHGYERTTGDIDLWIKPTNENRDKLSKVFLDAGMEEEDIASLKEHDFTKHTSFSWESEPEKMDFITHINLVEYEEANSNKIEYSWEGLILPFVNLRELILSKMNTGRKKDEADVEELQKIQSVKKLK
ncbi:MAG: nucleotidyltransferase [Saprospiraceae bacterium]